MTSPLVSGSISDCLNTPGTYTYRVDAIAADGRVAFQQASVTVGAAQSSLGGSWRLVNLNGAAIIPGTEITAVFGDGGRLRFTSGALAPPINWWQQPVRRLLSGSGQVLDQAGYLAAGKYQTVLA
jgi:hypothetical protein